MIWWDAEYPPLERLNRLGSKALPAMLGIEFDAIGDDWMRARMPVDERTHQPFGRLHGGASVALAETVASVAGAMCIDPQRFVTVGWKSMPTICARPRRAGFMAPHGQRRLAGPRRSGRSGSWTMPESWSASAA